MVAAGDLPALTGGTDSYYHLRRAELAAFTAMPPTDRWTDYPVGEATHWPAGYDDGLGLALRLAGVPGLVLTPLLCGVIAAGLFYLVALRFAPRRALFAAAFYALLPAAVYPSCLGALDHHCLEGLFLFAALAPLATGSWKGVAASAAVAAVSFFFITTWSVLVVLVVAAVMLRVVRLWLAGLVLLAAALAVPLAGWSYLTIGWHQQVSESRPLLRDPVTVLRVINAISVGFVLLPLGLIRWWRRRADPGAAACLALAVIALPLALWQQRFTLFLAPAAVLALVETLSWLEERNARKLALVLAIVAFIPTARGLAEMPGWAIEPAEDIRAALRFLRDRTPSAGDPLQAGSQPPWAVASSWDLGHEILVLGRRPVVANAFHTCSAGRALAHGILFGAPEEAARLAEANAVRYLFLRDFTADNYAWSNLPAGAPPLVETLAARLYFRGDTTLGWRRIYPEKANDPAPVQVWERQAEKP